MDLKSYSYRESLYIIKKIISLDNLFTNSFVFTLKLNFEGAVHKRLRVDLTASSFERNFITPIRAMSDFLLKPFHLEDLRKTQRRSPYENEPPITVYWRKDVEQRFFLLIINMNHLMIIINTFYLSVKGFGSLGIQRKLSKRIADA